MRKPTRSDVAQLAGVSKTTVTFVLAGRPGVTITEATRERVRRAAEELRYRPSTVAQALATGKTGAITVAFPNLLVPNYCQMLQTIEGLTSAHGYHLIASTIGRVGEKPTATSLYAILNGPCDAVILVDAHEGTSSIIDEVAPFHKPVVAMGIYGAPGVDCVEIDMVAPARQAIQHLLSAHPRRLAFFGFGSEEEASGVVRDAAKGIGDPRVIVFVRAMAEAGRPLEVIHGSHSGRRAKIQMLQRHIERHGCPDAIFCYDDEHAISAHHGLRRAGYRLPEDVILVGMDGNEECEYLEPPVSTIAMPVEEMCGRAWQFLRNRFAGDISSRQYVKLDAKLIVRASSVRQSADGQERKRESL